MTFDPIAAVVDALRTYPEPVSLPESLIDAEPLTLAEARSRLQQIAAVARELVKVIDQELAGVLQGSAMEYGGMVIRPNYGNGTPKVRDDGAWWEEVVSGLQHSPNPQGLIAALYPASSVRLTALPKLEAALGLEDGELRREHIVYGPASSPLLVMPKDRAPKFLQNLEDGEIRKVI